MGWVTPKNTSLVTKATFMDWVTRKNTSLVTGHKGWVTPKNTSLVTKDSFMRCNGKTWDFEYIV